MVSARRGLCVWELALWTASLGLITALATVGLERSDMRCATEGRFVVAAVVLTRAASVRFDGERGPAGAFGSR